MGVTSVHPPQKNTPGVFADGHGDEMHVVRHQTSSQKPHLRINQILPEQPQVRGAILVTGKGFSPVNPALGDVASKAADNATASSRHRLKDSAKLFPRRQKNRALQAVPLSSPHSQGSPDYRQPLRNIPKKDIIYSQIDLQ